MLTNKSKRIAIALFVRNPVPGKVKTRLAHGLGAENACTLYQAMVNDILVNIAVSKLPVFLFHDGTDAGELPQNWIDASCSVILQQGDSIGERMSAAFRLLFATDIKQVVLVGSDIPGLDAKLLESASRALATFAAAIVPAVDGGYCLIALKKESFNSRIFQDIEWSTGSVLQSTLERLNVCGLRVNMLESRQDIDTCDDLRAYCRNPSKLAHATNTWLATAGFLPAQSTSALNCGRAKDHCIMKTRGVVGASHHQGR